MKLPADKLKHIAIGLIVGAFIFVLFYAEAAAAPEFFKAHKVFWGMINGGAAVHLAKEGYDWLANRAAKAEGEPPIHGVEVLDAVAGEIGTIAIALACLAAGWV